jgi:hypothetical protein
MRLFICCVLIFIARSTFGQLGDLSYQGSLVDQCSDQPIVGATVVLQLGKVVLSPFPM